jgi:hypothetical protein
MVSSTPDGTKNDDWSVATIAAVAYVLYSWFGWTQCGHLCGNFEENLFSAYVSDEYSLKVVTDFNAMQTKTWTFLLT